VSFETNNLGSFKRLRGNLQGLLTEPLVVNEIFNFSRTSNAFILAVLSKKPGTLKIAKIEKDKMDLLVNKIKLDNMVYCLAFR
jgi:hypothetical protein